MSEGRQALEAEIRQAWEAGDFDRATTAAVKGYGPEVLGFLAARLRDHAAASDVFSMFCEDFWRGLARFQWRCSVRVWAYTLAQHAANRYAVQAHRRPGRNVPLSQAHAVSKMVERVRTATMEHLKTRIKSRMRELREQLTEEEQTLIILRVDKQMSWTELAEVLAYDGGAPSEAALTKEAARLRKRFQLAKDKLRKLAEADGLIESKQG